MESLIKNKSNKRGNENVGIYHIFLEIYFNSEAQQQHKYNANKP